jgi:uncharacterized Zn finger protein
MHAEEIDEQASLWLAREQNGLTGEEQAALNGWLEETPRNVVARMICVPSHSRRRITRFCTAPGSARRAATSWPTERE